MTQEEKTEDTMDKGYAELAVDPEYLAEQERRRKFRGLSRHRNIQSLPNEDEDGNEISGMWGITHTSGEPYEPSYTSQIAIFGTLEEAQNYYDAYSAALEEGQKNSHNDYTYAYCGIEFIPFATAKPVFHILYTISAYRSDDGKSRDVENQIYRLYKEDQVQGILSKGDDPHFTAAWADKDAIFHASYCDVAQRARKDEKEVIPAFPLLYVAPEKSWEETVSDEEYEPRYESFITFNPQGIDLLKG